MADYRVLNETLGLKTHGNPILQPKGSLKIGKNFECVRDNVYRKPRGREAYGSGLPASNVLQFLDYKERLLVHFLDGSLYYDGDGAGTFAPYSGTYSQPSSSYKIQSEKQSGNLYFTSSAGIQKLDSLTATPEKAGIDPGLDFDLRLVTGTWLDATSNDLYVAYRHMWSKFDANSNKVFGVPSNRQTVANTTGATRAVELRINIPENITTDHYLEIYRSTTMTQAIGGAALVPPEDFALVYQAKPTPAEIAAGYIVVSDVLPSGFRGTELYTNTTQEGIENANHRPPKAKSITKYKNYLFYGNIENLHRLYFNLISVSGLTAGTSGVSISDGTNTLTLGCVADIADKTVASAADSVGDVEFTTTGAHGYSVGDYVRFLDVAGAGGLPDAVNNKIFEVKASGAATTFTIDLAWDAAYTATAGTIDFYEDVGATPRFVLHSGSGSVATDIDETAKSIIRTINQASGNSTWYGYYESGYNDVVGKMQITTRDVGETQFYLYTDSATTGSQFTTPITQSSSVSGTADNGSGLIRITTTLAHGLSSNDTVKISGVVGTVEANGSFTVTVVDTLNFDLVGSAFSVAYVSGGTVIPTGYKSLNDSLQNAVMWSKIDQPEHVPLTNIKKLGSDDDPVLKVVGLKDSLFIIKKSDGIQRLTGASDTSFSFDEFDGTVECSQPNSIAKGQNSIFMMTTLGYVKISDIGVEVIGRDNEFKDLKPSFSTNYEVDGYGWFYEDEKSYFIATHAAETSTSNDTLLVYNTFTQSWMQREHGVYTNDSHVKLGRVVGSRIYYAPVSGSFITRERKTFTTDDLRLPSISNTVSAIDTGTKTVTFGSLSVIPKDSVIMQSSLTYRVSKVNSSTEVVLTTTNNLAVNVSLLVSGAADNGAGLIRVTTSNPHGLSSNNAVTIASVVGTVEANGDWVITVFDATNFDLNNSTFTNAYVSGGTVTNPIEIIPGIVSTLRYQSIHCGLPEWEKLFSNLVIFFDNDETRITNLELNTSSDLDSSTVTTELFSTADGWGLLPWGTSWGTKTAVDRMATLIPAEHSRGTYIDIELIHRRPKEQAALCGLSLAYEQESIRIDT